MASFSTPITQWLYLGVPAASGTVDVYQTGTTTHVTIYSDGALTTPISNPLTLNSDGYAIFYVATTVALRLDAKTSTGTLIKSIDPVYPVGGSQTIVIIGGTIDNTIIGGTTPAAGTFTTLIANTPTQGTANTNVATTAFVEQNNFGGFVNKFRNPQMIVAQRGTSGTITAGSPAYTVDGWIVSCTGANVTWLQGTNFGDPPLFGSGFLTVTGNTSVTNTFIKQRIEGSLCTALSNQQVTVQFGIANNTGASITPTLTIKNATATDNWAASTIVLNAVNLQPLGSASGSQLAYTFTAPSTCSTGLEITIDFGSNLNTNGKFIQFTNADIRITPGVASGLNSVPPYVEQRPISLEISLNQRYFVTTFGNGVIPAQNAGLSGALIAEPYAATAGSAFIQWNFPVQMRTSTSYSITTYNPSAANANWRDVTGSSDVVVSIDPDTAKGSSGIAICTQTTALTTGHRLYIHATASSEL